MYDYLRRSDVKWRKEQADEGKDLEGYEPTQEEKQKNTQPKQQMRMENSYGQMSLGVNREGVMTFVMSAKKRRDQTPAAGSEKAVNGQRAVQPKRNVYQNNDKNPLTATVVRMPVRTRQQQENMLRRLRWTLAQQEKQGAPENETVTNQLPFLFLRREQKQLQEIREQQRKCLDGEEKQKLAEIQQELEQQLQIEAMLQKDLERSMTAAVRNVEQKPKKDWVPWKFVSGILNAVLTDEEDENADTDEPQDDEKPENAEQAAQEDSDMK